MHRSTVSMVLGVVSAMAIASIAMAQTPSVNVMGSTTGTPSAPTSSVASTSTNSLFYNNTSSALTATPSAAYSAVTAASSTRTNILMRGRYPAIILNVNPQGSALMRGVVESVSTSTLSVRTWGGVWSVYVGSTTRMQKTQSLSAVQVGDIVGVEGSIASGKPLTVAASFVRDWTRK